MIIKAVFHLSPSQILNQIVTACPDCFKIFIHLIVANTRVMGYVINGVCRVTSGYPVLSKVRTADALEMDILNASKNVK